MPRYRNIVSDSDRWAGFEFRDGDIVISTPPKCGTTWTQTICALLIFQTPDFPKAVDLLSPWIDQSLRNRDEVFGDLAAQTHRRFIKTHTPLDGIPWDDRVTYICVARDPRDVGISMDHHIGNTDFQALFALRDKAVGSEDLPELMATIPIPAATEHDRLLQWIDDDAPLDASLTNLRFTLHHVRTFYDLRDKPNVVLLHYGDLKADLEGQMRALAKALGIDVPEDRWPELVNAATFESMKSKAAESAPNSTESIWLDKNNFFYSGKNGQWRDLLTDDDLAHYRERVEELTDPEFSEWIHQGPIA